MDHSRSASISLSLLPSRSLTRNKSIRVLPDLPDWKTYKAAAAAATRVLAKKDEPMGVDAPAVGTMPWPLPLLCSGSSLKRQVGTTTCGSALRTPRLTCASREESFSGLLTMPQQEDKIDDKIHAADDDDDEEKQLS
jgi:hypothetical protein